MKSPVGRVLVLNHHGIGDVLMSLPACRWLANELGKRLWMTTKDSLTEGLIKDERCGDNFVHFKLDYKHPIRVIETIWKLRKLQFDSILALYGYDCKIVSNFSHLIGCRNWICNSVDETEVLNRESLHKQFRHINIVEQLLYKNIPKELVGDYYFDHVDLSTANQIRKNGRYIVMVPGSGERERYKRWPLNEFISLGVKLLRIRPNWNIVISGAFSEFALGEKIEQEIGSPNIINLCGKISLKKLSGVFRKSQFVLGGDSGGLHIAKAAGARIVAIMGPTNYSLTGPIDTDVVIDLLLPGTPWYSRANYQKRSYVSNDPSMQIPARSVLHMIEKQNLLNI